MHPCLSVDEILRQVAHELVASGAKATAVSLACCCKGFEHLVWGVLWGSQSRLFPLLKTLPADVWKVEAGHFVSVLQGLTLFLSDLSKSFERIPTKTEWGHLRKYAREMRQLGMDAPQDAPITSDMFLTLQLRTADEPLLPKLKIFQCHANGALIPFIPLFLSRKTTSINIEFVEDFPLLTIASMITRLSIICPNLEYILLSNLPEDPLIVEAASEMVLGCNRDALQQFYVDSPLTMEARGVLFQLPKLSSLGVVIQGHTLLPPAALPNLSTIYVEFDDCLDWLRGFRGVVVGKLENVYFNSYSKQFGDFLGEFKNLALTTSAPTALQTFNFNTSQAWNPTYRSLLPFTQLRNLLIKFSCEDGCSSKVDDDIVIDLAQAMPELRSLQLGGTPCRTSGGITIMGLIALAVNCHLLSKLCIHFETASLVEATTGVGTSAPSDGKPIDRQQACALTDLEVGAIPIEKGAVFKVAMTLLRIFPCLFNIKSDIKLWKEVAETVGLVRQIDTFVHHAGEISLQAFNPPQ